MEHTTSGAVEAFLDHLVACGHCQSFPRSLCATGAELQKKAAQTFTPISVSRRPGGDATKSPLR